MINAYVIVLLGYWGLAVYHAVLAFRAIGESSEPNIMWMKREFPAFIPFVSILAGAIWPALWLLGYVKVKCVAQVRAKEKARKEAIEAKEAAKVAARQAAYDADVTFG